MPGVTVKDVPADKFVTAFADFLKRTGKVANFLTDFCCNVSVGLFELP